MCLGCEMREPLVGSCLLSWWEARLVVVLTSVSRPQPFPEEVNQALAFFDPTRQGFVTGETLMNALLSTHDVSVERCQVLLGALGVPHKDSRCVYGDV